MRNIEKDLERFVRNKSKHITAKIQALKILAKIEWQKLTEK